MRFSLQREVFLKPLAQVVNVVERRQTLPVLANLLVQVKDGQLSLTGTDLEVEMVARHAVEDGQDGETTIPARKLFEIVRALPDGSRITVSQTGDKVVVQAGQGEAAAAGLPANDFPSVDEVEATERVRVSEAGLKELIERTAFAMAQQDVRYYLNGLLFDLREQGLRCVATDGHRLALCEAPLDAGANVKRQIIVPRKGVTELQRLLEGSDPVQREVPRRPRRSLARAVEDQRPTTPTRKKPRKKSRPTPRSIRWRSASTSITCLMPSPHCAMNTWSCSCAMPTPRRWSARPAVNVAGTW